MPNFLSQESSIKRRQMHAISDRSRSIKRRAGYEDSTMWDGHHTTKEQHTTLASGPSLDYYHIAPLLTLRRVELRMPLTTMHRNNITLEPSRRFRRLCIAVVHSFSITDISIQSHKTGRDGQVMAKMMSFTISTIPFS